MTLAHFTGSDLTSTALVFGLAFVFMSWRAVTRQQRGNAVRFGVLGAGALAIAVLASVVHSSNTP